MDESRPNGLRRQNRPCHRRCDNRRCDNHRVAAHRRAMTGMFVGGLVVAGLLTFLPGRLMWAIFFGPA